MQKFKNKSPGEVSFKIAGVKYTVPRGGEVLIPERYADVLLGRISSGLPLERIGEPPMDERPEPSSPEDLMLKRFRAFEQHVIERLGVLGREQRERLSALEAEVAALKSSLGEPAPPKTHTRSGAAKPEPKDSKVPDPKPPAGAPAPQ